MPKPAARVGVNGFGVIGKRVAEAVSKQKDNFVIYSSIPEKLPDMKRAGIEASGVLEDLIKKVDVMIDCTPAGLGAKNKELYDKLGVKSVFQGGEKHELTGSSFVAQCNYEEK